MRPRGLTLLVCLLVAAASDLHAQQDPNTEKGFVAGKAYSFHGLDNVNLFNGNLNIKIPLGRTFPVSERLSYSFSLSYSGNNWNKSTSIASTLVRDNIGNLSCTGQEEQSWTEPNRDSNAGMGWLFTFGQLGTRALDEEGLFSNYCTTPSDPPDERSFPPGTTADPYQAPPYIAPDGSVHNFFPTLIPVFPSEVPQYAEPNVFYTNDGTYMRLQRIPMAYGAYRYLLEPGDGTIHSFDQNGVLTSIGDARGNVVNFTKFEGAIGEVPPPVPDYVACGDVYETWIVDDGHRRHYAYFQLHEGSGSRREPYTKTLCQLKVAAFDTTAGADYLFYYNWRVIARQYVITEEPADPTTVTNVVRVPLLDEIRLPDNTSYRAVYDIGKSGTTGLSSIDDGMPDRVSEMSKPEFQPAPCDEKSADRPCNLGDFSGHLIYMKLPTGGEHRWMYRPYLFPRTGTNDPEPPYVKGTYNPASAGVHSRRLSGDGRNDLWKYKNSWLGDGKWNNDFGYTTIEAPDATTRAYFTYCRSSCGSYAVPAEYGLPVSRHPPGAEAAHGPNPVVEGGVEYYMSTRTVLPNNKYQTTYVRYETDRGANARVQATLTVFEDGSRSLVKSSEWDGIGHYRTQEVSGFGTTDRRRTTTNYNPLRTRHQDFPWDKWVIGSTYDYVETTEYRGTEVRAKRRSEYCFDDKGTLLRKRTLRGSSRSAVDFMVVYHDSHPSYEEAVPDGNVSVEEYYGGDELPLSWNISNQCTDTFLGTVTSRVIHGHSYGVRNKTRYEGMNFLSLDLDIDPSGFVRRSRDTPGVATESLYDTSGRIREILTPRAKTVYSYTPGTATTGASIAVQQCLKTTGCANPLTDNRYYYDLFGRLIQQLGKLPSGHWSSIWMTLDSSDRVTATSVPVARTSSGFVKMPAGTKATAVTYDILGRTKSTTAPDGTCTDYEYPSAGETVRKTSIGPCGASAQRIVTETRDAQGRLLKVIEGDTADATHAAYDYRLDQISKVQIVDYNLSQQATTGPVQLREFHYDGAGLLESETHPENGTTSYTMYDARGQLLEKKTADCRYHQRYTYDKAGRLIGANPGASGCGDNSGKQFIFANDGSPGDKRLGKLHKAIRYNATPIGLVRVTETHAYGDIMGNLTEKETLVEMIGAGPQSVIQKFKQQFGYGDLGQLERAAYPTCYGPVGCGEATVDGVIYEYNQGLLTGVRLGVFSTGSPATPPLADAGSLATLSYHPNGARKEVVHGNGVTDESAADPNGMARPSAISFRGFAECELPLLVNPASATVPYGETYTLSAGAANSAYRYQWYQVENGTETVVAGATGAQFTTPPVTKVVRYVVFVRSTCSGKRSGEAKLTPTLAAPTALVASRYGQAEVRVTWTATRNAPWYQVERRGTNGTFTSAGTTNSTVWTASDCAAGQTCVYRVRASAPEAGITSEPSNADLTTILSFANLGDDDGEVKAFHVQQMLDAVNAVLAASGRPLASWSQILPANIPPPGPQEFIESDHLTALRTLLDQALGYLQLPTSAYTPSSLEGALISASHIEQLRERTQ